MTGEGWGVRRDAERLRVQELGSPCAETNRGATTGAGADDATCVEANAAARSAASEVSDTETVREREELLPAPPQRSRAVPSQVNTPLSPGSLFASSEPSTLMLLRRPRCRSRSMPCHISSVTPKRSRHRRSWRARESGRVRGLWHMAHGDGCPPCLAVLLRCRERSRGVPNCRLHSAHLYLASFSGSCTTIRV